MSVDEIAGLIIGEVGSKVRASGDELDLMLYVVYLQL